MTRIVKAAVLAMAAWMFLAGIEATAATAAEYLAAANQYDQQAAVYERMGGYYAQAAQQYRALAARYRQLAAQLAGSTGSTGGGSGGSASGNASYWAQVLQATKGRANQLITWLGMNSGYKRYVIYYYEAPIYIGQGFGTVLKTYNCNSYAEATRTVSMLGNNGQYISSITATNR